MKMIKIFQKRTYRSLINPKSRRKKASIVELYQDQSSKQKRAATNF